MTYQESAWTDERFELLKNLNGQGSNAWVARQINEQTGSAFTRNAVISKCVRSGLKSGTTQGCSAGHQIERKPRKPKLKRGGPNWFITGRGEPHAPELNLLDYIESGPTPAEFLGISFSKLTDKVCHYPRGIHAPFLYCGQSVKEGSSYCPHCHSLCYQKPEPPSHKRDRIKYYSVVAERAA